MRSPRRAASGGFTLIEVLVAIVVLSLGLLAMAGLQAVSLSNNKDAYQRTVATLLSYSIVDAMRANQQLAASGGYNLAMADPTPSGTDIVSADLSTWRSELAARLPQGGGSVNLAAGVVTVVVQWDDSKGASSPKQFSMQAQL